MKKALKITGYSILALGVLIFAFKLIFLDCSSVPDRTSITLTPEKLRTAALQLNRQLPTRINAMLIMDGFFPKGVAVAGKFIKYQVPYYAYQIVYTNSDGSVSHSIIVDTAQNKSLLLKGVEMDFFEDNYNKMQQAMLKADSIIVTHEHADHMGGISTSPYLDRIISKVYVTPEQKTGPLLKYVKFPEGALEKAKTLNYDNYFTFAPGVVLVKTPGHTPGNQIVFVKLASGKEVMIAGDIVWNMDGILLKKQRPIITSLFLKENRDNVGNQIVWLYGLEKDAAQSVFVDNS